MPRMRITATAVLDYDARFEDYGTESVDVIKAMDEETAEDDLYLFLDNEDTKWTVHITVLDDES